MAISVDPPAVTRRHVEKQGYPFVFLSDEEIAVIRLYDLVHEKGRKNAVDISRPAEFLVDSKGTVLWRNLTESYRVRLRGEEALKGIDILRARRNSEKQ